MLFSNRHYDSDVRLNAIIIIQTVVQVYYVIYTQAWTQSREV